MKQSSLIILIVGAAMVGFCVYFIITPLNANTTIEKEPPPSSYSSNAIATTTDGRWVIAVNPDSNSVSILSATNQALIAEIPTSVAPQQVSISRDNTRAYVTNKGSDSISVIDLGAQAVVADIPVGDRPVGMALSPDNRFLAVAELGEDTIRFLSTTTYKTLSTHRVLDRPYGLTFTGDGRYLLVSHLLNGNIIRLTAQPFVLFLPSLQQIKPIFAQPVQPQTKPVLTGVSQQLEISTWPQVAPAPAIVVNKAGTRAYMPQTMANGLGLNTQFDNTVFPKVSVLNLETWTHQTSEHVSLPETDRPVGLPWAVTLARNDTELWVVNAASNDVSVIDISNPAGPVRRAHIPVGHNPRGIALSPDGQTAYINNTLDGTVSVVDTTSYTVTTVIPVTNIPLPPILLAGKRLFHSSSRPELSRAAWISCNTCHIEGEHDGRTWQLQFLGDTPPGATPVITRNTTSLLGMVETYPLRWSAEWDESADSEFSIRFEQFGVGLIDGEMHPPLGLPNQGRSAELDALATFIDGLVLPSRAQMLSPAAQRGRIIFEDTQTGCLSCHPPPLYSDLQQHDVGTANGTGEWLGPEIDTPTLRFLFDSAPYLHNGTAPSLYEVLTSANPQDEHGKTSHLTNQELDDLVTFLLALPFE